MNRAGDETRRCVQPSPECHAHCEQPDRGANDNQQPNAATLARGLDRPVSIFIHIGSPPAWLTQVRKWANARRAIVSAMGGKSKKSDPTPAVRRFGSSWLRAQDRTHVLILGRFANVQKWYPYVAEFGSLIPEVQDVVRRPKAIRFYQSETFPNAWHREEFHR